MEPPSSFDSLDKEELLEALKTTWKRMMECQLAWEKACGVITLLLKDLETEKQKISVLFEDYDENKEERNQKMVTNNDMVSTERLNFPEEISPVDDGLVVADQATTEPAAYAAEPVAYATELPWEGEDEFSKLPSPEFYQTEELIGPEDKTAN